MIRPAYLQKGDRIALISTARKIDDDIFNSARDIFSSWGLELIAGENLYASEDQFAGSDELRLRDLQWALDDETINAVICARGGYGTARIIDGLSWHGFKKSPKWIVGYSDVSVLHGHLQSLGFESIHATMPVNFRENSKESIESLKSSLFGEGLSYRFSSHAYNREGSAKGVLVGGNLSILYSLNGSLSMPETKNCILFIEDLDEYLYHIDRMMLTLKRAGHFKELAGMVVGAMSDMNDNDIPFGKNALEIIRDQMKEFSFPICFDFPAGHINDNRTLIMGREISLIVGKENCELRF